MDYGASKNMRVYGHKTPPVINLKNIKSVPIGLFVGKLDVLATIKDNRWAKTQLKTLKFYREYNLGHLGFMIGKDMTYFSDDVMKMLNVYHPAKVPHKEQTTFLE